MNTHKHLLQLWKTPKVRQFLRKLGVEVTLKDIYWWYRWRRHGVSVYDIANTSISYESFAAPDLAETDVISDLLSNLSRDDVFYDIGSDRGWYSCFASKIVEDGQIVVFEPHPARRRVLARNISHTGAIDRTIIRSEALSDTNGSAEFGYRIRDESGSGEFVAKLARGDELIEKEGLPYPTVIKIDVEGAEQAVLEGLQNTINRTNCRLIYVELHEKITNYGGSWEALEELLVSAGYEVSELHMRDNQPFLRAEKF